VIVVRARRRRRRGGAVVRLLVLAAVVVGVNVVAARFDAQVDLSADRRFTVSGHGYSVEGRIRTTDGEPLPATVEQTLLAMALCTDSELRDGDVIGDPTEGALLVLAEKGGIDTAALRRDKPRVREVPFDSDYKFMATFHRWKDRDGQEVVRGFVKGAPDVLAARADRYLGGTDILAFDDDARGRYAGDNDELAADGMRVLAIGAQDFTTAELDQYERLLQAGDNDIYDWVSGKAAVPPEADTPVLRKLLAFRVRF